MEAFKKKLALSAKVGQCCAVCHFGRRQAYRIRGVGSKIVTVMAIKKKKKNVIIKSGSNEKKMHEKSKLDIHDRFNSLHFG